jgi:endonuclease/exonuclease/phosphatase family metal-dependent hydrolase
MKLVTYNIRYGLGLDQCYDLERIADAVHGADIIALQEVERFWERSGMVDQPEVLGQFLKGYYWVYSPVFDMDASEIQENGHILNRRCQFGTMLLSRWPIISSKIFVFPKISTTENYNMDTGGLEGVIETPFGPIRIYSVHLSAMNARERLLQIDGLLKLHHYASRQGGAWTGSCDYKDPIERKIFIDGGWTAGGVPPAMPNDAIIMGDCNFEAETEEYCRFVGKIDPLCGRVIQSDLFVDSWSVAKKRIGEVATSWWPDPPEREPGHGLRLDYCFLSSRFSSKVEKVMLDLDAVGSDHKPYWVELSE